MRRTEGSQREGAHTVDPRRTPPAHDPAVEAARRITIEVASWPGVETAFGPCGALDFTYGDRPIGRLRGDREAQFRFPRSVRAALLRTGRLERSPLVRPGLAVRRIRTEADISEVLRLLRLNYDRIARWRRVA